MKLKSQRDFFAGLMFTLVGAGFAWGATTYTVGTGARMGAGYFPLVLGILLAVLGLAVIFSSLTVETEDGEPIGKIAWRPLILIILANLVFGVLLGGLPSLNIPAMGLIAAIYALTIIAAAAGHDFSLRSSLILATVLAAGSYVVFILGVQLQLQVWPTFISG